jgi:hypothetical protein
MTCPYGSFACVGVVLSLAAANHAKAQAWVLPRGEGDVGVTYLAYSFPQFDLFATYIGFVGGTDTHAGRAITISILVTFRLVGSHR